MGGSEIKNYRAKRASRFPDDSKQITDPQNMGLVYRQALSDQLELENTDHIHTASNTAILGELVVAETPQTCAPYGSAGTRRNHAAMVLEHNRIGGRPL